MTTIAEWTLIESSLPGRIGTLSPARLKAKIARARTLRRKYVDLVRCQHRSARPLRRGTPTETLNARTKRKVELFAEVLARFESRLAGLAAKTTARPKHARARQARAPGGKARTRAAATVPAKATKARAPLVPKSAVAARSGQQRIHAHLSGRGRRRQSRRDAKSRRG